MWTFLLALLPDFLKVWLGFKTSTAESLGKAEERVSIEHDNVVALTRENAVDANLPQDKTAMERLLQDGKL